MGRLMRETLRGTPEDIVLALLSGRLGRLRKEGEWT